MCSSPRGHAGPIGLVQPAQGLHAVNSNALAGSRHTIELTNGTASVQPLGERVLARYQLQCPRRHIVRRSIPQNVIQSLPLRYVTPRPADDHAELGLEVARTVLGAFGDHNGRRVRISQRRARLGEERRDCWQRYVRFLEWIWRVSTSTELADSPWPTLPLQEKQGNEGIRLEGDRTPYFCMIRVVEAYAPYIVALVPCQWRQKLGKVNDVQVLTQSTLFKV